MRVGEAHQYAVAIPNVTPRGQTVSIQSGERHGVHMMHAESPDLSELYFEVTSHPSLADHTVLAGEQQTFLRGASADGVLTEVSQATFGSHSGATLEFRGMLQGRFKVRRFLFVDGAARTYRIVFDPTSALNERLLESLELTVR